MSTADDTNDTLNPLIGALRRGHYLLYCQNIQPLASQPGRVVRPYQEVLIRYLEEETRLLPPGMFFPVLQELGLMALLDCWVVSQVLKLQQAGIAGRPGWIAPRNSINLAEDSVIDPEFADFVVAQLAKWNPSADTLSFEVLEVVALSHIEALLDLISTLAPRGCSFGIGSFKGSPEQMTLLDTLPLAFVKIDGSLIRKILVSQADQARVARIHKRCHELGIVTIAELVEDLETLTLLTDMGVDYAQGFQISQPAPFLSD
jgi:EAL domain-containing protein (putative c-di-GMP-specific phosphodiesterase class I)